MTDSNLRPCLVKGEKALFHQWASRSEIIPPSVALGGHNGGVVSRVFGLIEYDDGKMAEVYPENIQFVNDK